MGAVGPSGNSSDVKDIAAPHARSDFVVDPRSETVIGGDEGAQACGFRRRCRGGRGFGRREDTGAGVTTGSGGGAGDGTTGL